MLITYSCPIDIIRAVLAFRELGSEGLAAESEGNGEKRREIFCGCGYLFGNKRSSVGGQIAMGYFVNNCEICIDEILERTERSGLRQCLCQTYTYVACITNPRMVSFGE